MSAGRSFQTRGATAPKARSPIVRSRVRSAVLALLSDTRLVLGLPGRAPVMSAIRDKLHWLSYPQRATFKLCLTTYRCLHDLAPPYLTRFCTPLSTVAGRTHLRAAGQHKLFVPRTSTSTFGSRAFSSSSPLSWNALPPQLRNPAISIMQHLQTILEDSSFQQQF